MCEGGGQAPGSLAEALQMADAAVDFLNSVAIELNGAACGPALTALGGLHSKLIAARAGFLRRFDAADAHDSDGYASSGSWLAAMAQMSPKAARAAVRQMRQLGAHPQLAAAMAGGALSESWFAEITEATKKFPAGMLRTGTDQILADAAAAGAGLDDLKVIAAAAYERWRAQHPDPDDDGFDDRYVAAGTTFGGAGIIRGNLTPECNAAVQAVLEALGKKHGPEDTRTEGQRFHDALQLGCELLIRARMVPDRAGADTQVVAHIPFGQLRAWPGGSAIEQAWLNARTGEPGYLTGNDAETAACDSLTIAVVTGHADMHVIDQIIDLALTAYDHHLHRSAGTGADGTACNDSPGGTAGSDSDSSDSSDSSDRADTGSSAGKVGNDSRDGCARIRAMSPDARDALRSAIARLAADFLSGPNGLASVLRTSLLAPPYNTPSLPLDIGYSDDIPAHIRRAVTLRDKMLLTIRWIRQRSRRCRDRVGTRPGSKAPGLRSGRPPVPPRYQALGWRRH